MFYFLPNKRPVDEDGAIDAMLDDNRTNRYFLDVTTGDVGCIETGSEEGQSKLTAMQREMGRYRELPRVSDGTKVMWLETFAEMVVTFDDVPFRDAILKRLKSSGFAGAHRLLVSHNDGEWIPAWEPWEGDHAFEDLGAWLKENVPGSTQEWKGCDDCAICRASKNGAGLQELLDAFEEQRRIDEDDSTDNGRS